MADIVGECGGLGNIWVDATQRFSDARLFLQDSFGQPACNLGNLQGVGKAIVKDPSFFRPDDLRHFSETKKTRAVKNPISVPLELAARLTRG
jgi:hypothetical protein